jgi:hypothetical protein
MTKTRERAWEVARRVFRHGRRISSTVEPAQNVANASWQISAKTRMGAALTRRCLPGLRQVAGTAESIARPIGKMLEIPHDGERTEVVGKFAKFYLPHKTGLLADPGHIIALAAMASQRNTGLMLGMRPEWLRTADRRSVRSSKCGRKPAKSNGRPSLSADRACAL